MYITGIFNFFMSLIYASAAIFKKDLARRAQARAQARGALRAPARSARLRRAHCVRAPCVRGRYFCNNTEKKPEFL